MKYLIFLMIVINTLLIARTEVSSESQDTESTTVTIVTTPGSSSGGSSSGSSGSGSGSSSSSTPPQTYLTISDYIIHSEEDAKEGFAMKFNVAFSKPLTNNITLQYEIVPNMIDLGSDIAKSGSFHSISVASGTKNVDIVLDVIDDTKEEDAEFFTIKLIAPAGDYKLLNGSANSTGVILDNDRPVTYPESGGKYLIYEHDTTQSNLKTKIVDKTIELDIYATSGNEILHDIKVDTNRECKNEVCTTSVEDGQDVRRCTATCTITKTTTKVFDDSMNIDRVILYRYKDYNKDTKECENPLRSMVLNEDDIDLNSDSKTTIVIPSEAAFRCAWIEVFGHSNSEHITNKVNQYEGKSDTFAIRPDRFELTIPTLATAGDSISFGVKALSKSGSKSRFYNQKNSVTFDMIPNDQKYNQTDIKDLGFNLDSFTFLDGEGSLPVTYKEVGQIDINISENANNYFAIIDNTKNFISPTVKTITYEPAKFSLSYSSNNYKDGSTFAFNTNNPDSMYSYIDLDIKALNSSGMIVKRYTKDYYAKDTNITLSQSIFSKNSATMKSTKGLGATQVDTAMINNGTKKDTTILYAQSDFEDGVLITNKLRQSFTRVKNLAKEPIELQTHGVGIAEKLKPSINGDDNQTGVTTLSYHYYGRAHVAPSPVMVVGTDLDASVYYEVYCRSCDAAKFAEISSNSSSVDSVYWYVLKNYSDSICNIEAPSVSALYMSDVTNIARVDANTINMTVSKAPHENKVSYKPSYEYLLFDKINGSINEHKFLVKFTTGGNKWAGEGDLGSTVDLNVSKQGNQAVEW